MNVFSLPVAATIVVGLFCFTYCDPSYADAIGEPSAWIVVICELVSSWNSEFGLLKQMHLMSLEIEVKVYHSTISQTTFGGGLVVIPLLR